MIKELGIIDWALFSLIISITFILGVIAWYRAKTYDEFLIAGRKIGLFQTIWVSAGFVTAALLAVGGLGYQFGVAGAWFFILLAIGFWLLAFTISTRLRKLGKYNLPDVYELRYGSFARITIASVALFSFSALLGIGFVGAGFVLSIFTGLDLWLATLIVGIIFIVKVMIGGWPGVSYTTTFQAIITLIGLLLVFIVAIPTVGGWEGLSTAQPLVHGAEATNLFDPTWAPLLVWAFFPAMTLEMLITCDAYQVVFASKSPETARNGFIIGGIIVLIVGLLSALIGVAGTKVFPIESLHSVEEVIPSFVYYLPHGLLGLAAGSLLAGASSLVDLDLMVGGTLIARGFFPGKDIGANMLRLFCVIVGFGALAFAILMPSIIDLTMLALRLMLSASLPAIVGAFIWKRGNSAGAIASAIVGFLSTIILTFVYLPTVAGTQLEFIMEPGWIATALSSITFVAASLATERPTAEQIQAL